MTTNEPSELRDVVGSAVRDLVDALGRRLTDAQREAATFRASRQIVEHLTGLTAEVRGRMLPAVVNAMLAAMADQLGKDSDT